jgi:putative glutamine amidotransferase
LSPLTNRKLTVFLHQATSSWSRRPSPLPTELPRMQIRATNNAAPAVQTRTSAPVSSADPTDRWAPTGEVAIPHPKPNFAPQLGIDKIVSGLEAQWARRMDGQERCVVGVIVERGWRPETEHDEVLNICDAVMDSGGLPKLLYVGNGNGDVKEQMSGINALAVPGGRDIDPAKYGATLGPNMDPNEPDPVFDDFEIAAIRSAYASGMPLLGHCRGTQIMNVAGDGTMHQHIPADFKSPEGWGSKYGTPVNHRPEAVRHDYALRVYPAHMVYAEEGSRLHGIAGALQSVNSVHHQCIAAISPLLVPVAFALDGLVEGVQRQGMPWQAGYQFHPEALRYTDSRYQQVYDHLVADGEKFKSGELPRPA